MTCKYKAVLFDVGQTLICTSRSVGEIYSETAARYGVDVVPEELDAVFRRLWVERRAALHGGTSEGLERQWWRDLVADSFACAGRQCEPPKLQFEQRFDAFFDDLFDLFMRPETWNVFEDVAPALEALREMGVRRAVVSNWDSRLETLLLRMGLSDWFEFALTSARVGYRKPDPRIFQAALGRLDLPAGYVAHVGDSYEDDVEGARNAGITPVLVDREALCEEGPHVIRSLEQLPALLCRSG